MAAAFALVSKNQTLKLAFKSLIFSLVVFWFREVGGFLPALILVCLYMYAYLRPLIQIKRFLISAITLLALPFITPSLGLWEAYFSIFIGLLLFMLIGIKDLVFVRRRELSQLLYFLILGFVIYMYFPASGLNSQILIFLFIALLFRELYSSLLEGKQRKSLLISLVYGLVAIELSWATSLLPLSHFSISAIIVATLFIAHDFTLNHKLSSISRRLVLRDFIVFVATSLIAIFSSTWGLI